MKKTIVLLFAILTLVCFVTCGKKDKNAGKAPGAPAETARAQTPAHAGEDLTVNGAGAEPEFTAFPFAGHPDKWVCSAAFSPDGSMALTASDDGIINVIDTATGRLYRIPANFNRIVSLAMNHDNTRFLAVLYTGEIELYDVLGARKNYDISFRTSKIDDYYDYDGYYYPAMFSPDGSMILAKDREKITLYNENKTHANVKRELENTSWGMVPVSFSPDGSMILAKDEKNLILYDTASGRQIRTLSGHTGSVNSAAFNSNGTQIVSISYDKTIRLWDTASGRQIKSFSGQPEYLSSVTFASDDEHILFTARNDIITLFNISTGAAVKSVYNANRIASLAFSPDGSKILTGTDEGIIDLYNFNDGIEIKLFSFSYLGRNFIETVQFSSDGRRLDVISGGHDLQIWDMDTGRRSDPKVSGRIIAANRDGTRIISNDYYQMKLWDALTGSEIKTYPDQVETAEFSPDGRQIITFDNFYGNRVKMFDVATGNEIRTFAGKFFAFSPDCKKMLVRMSRENRGTELLDVNTGEKTVTFENMSNDPSLAVFSADGSLLLSGVRLWNALTGAFERTFSGHSDSVTSCAFSPDARLALTGSNDGTARLWNVQTGDEVVKFSGLTGTFVKAVDFSPDGKWIALGGATDRIAVINVERYVRAASAASEEGTGASLERK